MALPPKDLKGPGLLYVSSHISQPAVLDEPTYLRWYDEDHIREILEGEGIETAMRFKRAAPVQEGEDPYLSLYPIDDMAYLLGPAFKHITVHSDLLPGSGLCYDLAEFDTRYYELVQVFDPTGKGKGHTKTLLSAQLTPSTPISAADLDAWYRAEHLSLLSRCPSARSSGYLRTTRYRLAYARSNATSRALKGLISEEEAKAATPDAPTWIALHEFEGETVDVEALFRETETEWTRGVLGGMRDVKGVVYKVAKVHGKGELFHGREV